MSVKRYAVGGTDGWLNIKREPSGTVVAIPEYLRVDHERASEGRDHFRPTEGVERGKAFSVKTGNLKAGDPGYRPPAALQFDLRRGVLVFPGGQARAITSARNPIAVGQHPIALPDFPHDAGSAYMSHSPYAKTWFYLGQGHAVPGRDDRYLHPGRVSEGCITVEPADWTWLYRYLILCRSGDGSTLGTVTVVR